MEWIFTNGAAGVCNGSAEHHLCIFPNMPAFLLPQIKELFYI